MAGALDSMAFCSERVPSYLIGSTDGTSALAATGGRADSAASRCGCVWPSRGSPTAFGLARAAGADLQPIQRMVRSFKDLNRNGRRAAPRFRSSGLACSCLARVLCRMPRERAHVRPCAQCRRRRSSSASSCSRLTTPPPSSSCRSAAPPAYVSTAEGPASPPLEYPKLALARASVLRDGAYGWAEMAKEGHAWVLELAQSVSNGT